MDGRSRWSRDLLSQIMPQGFMARLGFGRNSDQRLHHGDLYVRFLTCECETHRHISINGGIPIRLVAVRRLSNELCVDQGRSVENLHRCGRFWEGCTIQYYRIHVVDYVAAVVPRLTQATPLLYRRRCTDGRTIGAHGSKSHQRQRAKEPHGLKCHQRPSSTPSLPIRPTLLSLLLHCLQPP